MDTVLVHGVVDDPTTAPDDAGSLTAVHCEGREIGCRDCMGLTFLNDFAAECGPLSLQMRHHDLVAVYFRERVIAKVFPASRVYVRTAVPAVDCISCGRRMRQQSLVSDSVQCVNEATLTVTTSCCPILAHVSTSHCVSLLSSSHETRSHCSGHLLALWVRSQLLGDDRNTVPSVRQKEWRQLTEGTKSPVPQDLIQPVPQVRLHCCGSDSSSR